MKKLLFLLVMLTAAGSARADLPVKGPMFSAVYFVGNYGADMLGVADATTALQNCLNAAQDGGTCLVNKKAILKLSGNITIPRAATLDCGLEALTDLTPPLLAASAFGPGLRLSATKSILFGDTSGKIKNCLITPDGMVFPQANSSAWTGTAINTNGKTNPSIVNTTIVGFDTCIQASASQRAFIDTVAADCAGITNGGSVIAGNNGDLATVTNLKLQVLGTAVACPDRTRGGTGLQISGFGFFDNIISMDSSPSVSITGQSQIFIGKMWLDYSCAPGTSVGVAISAVDDLDIQHLDLNGMQTGITISNQNLTRMVHINNLWMNKIGQDGVALGLAAGTTSQRSGGDFAVNTIHANKAATIGRYAINILDGSGTTNLIIDGGTIYSTNGGAAPYINTGVSSAGRLKISDGIVSDLADQSQLYGTTTIGSCTGLGASGTCMISSSLRSDPRSGVITLSPAGGGPGASGAVTLTWPAAISSGSGCVLSYRKNTGTWTTPVPLILEDLSTVTTQISWANTGALTAGQVYQINFKCSPS